MENNLKLYVWDDVLVNYSSGTILVMANSVSHARDLVAKEYYGVPYAEVRNLDYYNGQVLKDIQSEPEIITTPKAFLCWGSE
jgi:hypothetical protein